MSLGIRGKAVLTLAMVAMFGAGMVQTAQAESRRNDNRHDNRQEHYRGDDRDRGRDRDHGPKMIRSNDRQVIINYINVDYNPDRYASRYERDDRGHGWNRGRGHDKHGHNDRRYPSYTIGKRLPDYVQWRPIPRDLYVRLKPVPVGYRYVQVDSDVLLMSEATRMIIDAVTLLSAVNGRG
jgi:Ni/Co efflux regulator RcnB